MEINIFYRFWFYSWLFKDVSRGNMWERAAAGRHNREQAQWLPTYMRRWSFMMVVLFSVAMIIENVMRAPALSALFYVPSILTVPYNLVTLTAWIFLRKADGLQ